MIVVVLGFCPLKINFKLGGYEGEENLKGLGGSKGYGQNIFKLKFF